MNTDVPERLPTRPLRNWLLAWRIWTGDPPETIARGFDLDEGLVAELVSPRPPLMLETDGAIDMCRWLRLDPNETWEMNRVGLSPTGIKHELADERLTAILAILDR